MAKPFKSRSAPRADSSQHSLSTFISRSGGLQSGGTIDVSAAKNAKGGNFMVGKNRMNAEDAFRNAVESGYFSDKNTQYSPGAENYANQNYDFTVDDFVEAVAADANGTAKHYSAEAIEGIAGTIEEQQSKYYEDKAREDGLALDDKQFDEAVAITLFLKKPEVKEILKNLEKTGEISEDDKRSFIDIGYYENDITKQRLEDFIEEKTVKSATASNRVTQESTASDTASNLDDNSSAEQTYQEEIDAIEPEGEVDDVNTKKITAWNTTHQLQLLNVVQSAQSRKSIITETNIVNKNDVLKSVARDEVNPYEWDKSFPEIIPQTTGTILKSHKDYDAAKSGDMDAAMNVIESVVKPERIQALAKRHPNAVLVAIHAQEAKGKNKLPIAFAYHIERTTNLILDPQIVQTNQTSHTGADALTRLFAVPEFTGEIIKGQEYILIDDVATSGSTFKSAKEYIEASGGKVVEVATLFNTSNPQAGYGGYLAPKPETLATLEKKFDVNSLNKLLFEYGIAKNISGLTNGQASYLSNFSSVDSIRNRFVKAGFTGSDRYRGQEMGQKSQDNRPSSQKQTNELENPSTLKTPSLKMVAGNRGTNLENLYNENGEIDYEQLKTVAGQVISGKSKIIRLNESEEEGRIRGGSQNVELSLLLGANQSTNQTGGRQEKRSKDEQVLEDYAKNGGFWVDDYKAFTRNLTYLKSGVQSDVYVDAAKPTAVIKLTPIPHVLGADSDILRFIDDKIAIHNSLPHTAPYELTGFTRNSEGSLLAILEQPFIQGEETTKLEPVLVKQLQTEAGLLLDYTGTKFVNSRVTVSDIVDHNVIKTADGQFYIFDPIISLTNESQYKPLSVEQTENENDPQNFKKIAEEGDYNEQQRLQTVPTAELFAGKATFVGENVELDLKASENLRRHLAELYYQNHGTETDESAFEGITLGHAATQTRDSNEIRPVKTDGALNRNAPRRPNSKLWVGSGAKLVSAKVLNAAIFQTFRGISLRFCFRSYKTLTIYAKTHDKMEIVLTLILVFLILIRELAQFVPIHI